MKSNEQKEKKYDKMSDASIVSRRSRTQIMAITAMMTAVTCILAPLSIPIGPVPISFTNLAIYLSLYLLGCKMGTVSYVVYMFLGMLGLPVFSGFSGGLGKLLGPTGGYIIGFIPMAIIAGIVIDKYSNRILQFIAMVVGTAVCYAFGTAWFCVVMDTTVMAALSLCVFSFIPGDIVKMVIAVRIGPVLRDRLKKIGVWNQ